MPLPNTKSELEPKHWRLLSTELDFSMKNGMGDGRRAVGGDKGSWVRTATGPCISVETGYNKNYARAPALTLSLTLHVQHCCPLECFSRAIWAIFLWRCVEKKQKRENFPGVAAASSADISMATVAFHPSLLALATQGGAWHDSLPTMLCWQAALRCM